MIAYEEGARLKGKRVAVVFQSHTRFVLLHGSSRDKATTTYFEGNEENPVVCTIEQSYHCKSSVI